MLIPANDMVLITSAAVRFKMLICIELLLDALIRSMRNHYYTYELLNLICFISKNMIYVLGMHSVA
jgi:hypothetical protein